MQIKVQKLHPDAKIPAYAHGPLEDAGFDLVAIEDLYLIKGAPVAVRTGLSFEIPAGFEMQIRPRSGLAFKYGLTVVNSPGTIDPGYRGEVKVGLIWNGYKHNDTFKSIGDCWGTNCYKVSAGDRIAQAVLARYEPVQFVVCTEFASSERGAGGFGSSGQ